MFRRLFCCKVVPPSQRPGDRGDSSPCPPKSGGKEETESVGSRLSLKRLTKRLWCKTTAPSQPKISRNQVAPAPFTESEQIPGHTAGAELQVTEAWTSNQKTKTVEPKKTSDHSRFGQQKTKTVELMKTNDHKHFGLPNIGNSCYLNASVQSIMNIAPFMDSISAQENIWKHNKNAELLGHVQGIVDLRTPHFPKKYFCKVKRLSSFKQIIAAKAPEFRGRQQKDAHEFLTVLIEQIQSLAPTLQMSASSLGTTYLCPVQDLMCFSMNWTRTCHSCGIGSSRREDVTNISLNMHSYSTVDLLLQEYLKEAELKFRCTCGGQKSSLKSSFASLPKVLILHLKRFRFTPEYRLEKVNDDVHLNRDLVVCSRGDAGCFSLMGVISHIGPSANSGHYIYDGRSPADSPHEPADRWLNYNDSRVQETTGRAVCRNRQSTACILFYQRVTGE